MNMKFKDYFNKHKDSNPDLLNRIRALEVYKYIIKLKHLICLYIPISKTIQCIQNIEFLNYLGDKNEI